MLGLHFCARAFSSCGKRGPLFITVRGPLTVAASLVAEHRLQTRRLSSCGTRAYLLRGMWDLPRPGLEPVSPALAGRLSTTAPPGKSSSSFLKDIFIKDRILGWQLYSFQHFGDLIPLSSGLYFSVEKMTVSLIAVALKVTSFPPLLVTFKIFSIFCFHPFWYFYVCFYLSCLGLVVILEYVAAFKYLKGA